MSKKHPFFYLYIYNNDTNMKLSIKNTDIELIYTFRALFIYEKLTGKTFNPQNTTDLMIFFYSLILAASPNIQLTFDELVDICDNNINLFLQFQSWLSSEFSKQGQFRDTEDKTDKDDKTGDIKKKKGTKITE